MKVSFPSNTRPSGIHQKVTLDSSYANTAKNSGHFWYDSPSKDFYLWVRTSLWDQAGPHRNEFLLWPEESRKTLITIPFLHSFIVSFPHWTDLCSFTYESCAGCHVLGTQRWKDDTCLSWAHIPGDYVSKRHCFQGSACESKSKIMTRE